MTSYMAQFTDISQSLRYSLKRQRGKMVNPQFGGWHVLFGDEQAHDNHGKKE